MAPDPLANLVDAPLFIVPQVLERLRAYRHQPTPENLAGVATRDEQARLEAELDALAGRLLAGVQAHPTKFWVMTQFQKTLERCAGDSAAARRQLGGELNRLMTILGIDSSDAWWA